MKRYKFFYYLKRSRVSIDGQDDIHFWRLGLSLVNHVPAVTDREHLNLFSGKGLSSLQNVCLPYEYTTCLTQLTTSYLEIYIRHTSNVLGTLNTSTLSAFTIPTQARVVKSSGPNSRVSSQSVRSTVLNLPNDISCLCHCKSLSLQ